MRILPLVLFDVLFVFFAVLVYGASASAGIAAASSLWGATSVSRGFAVVVGYFVFLHAFVVVVGVVKRIVQRPLHTGLHKVGFNREYFNWGLNSIFQGLFITSFFDRQIHIIFYLKYFYYRMMGMKLPFNAVIGTRVVIRQAELIELGSKVVLGEMSGLYGHMSPDGKLHFQGRIRIGDGSLVGGYSVICPDVEIGRETVVGTQTTVLPGARIGDRVRIAPLCLVGRGAVIADGARLSAGANLSHGASVGPGETWAGNPAVRIEGREAPKKEESRDAN